MRGDFGPAHCPVCGSVGSRATMLDHLEDAHPGVLIPLVAVVATARTLDPLTPDSLRDALVAR